MKFILLLLVLSSCSGNSTSGRKISSLESLNDQYGIPGLAGLIQVNDEVKEIAAAGLRKAGDPTPLEATDQFHLGSCTKAMTATMAGLFVEEGKLSWSAKMKDLLPENELHPLYADMTFETLLVHRAGLPVEHELVNEVRYMDPVEGRKLIARRLLLAAPLTLPGASYKYSNYSYIIAGHVLEQISGDSWENLILKLLWKPLGMTSCGLGATSDPTEASPTQPWGHMRKDGIPVPRHFDNPLTFGPASSVHCSLADWSKFLTVHLKGLNGESNIVSAATYKKLHSVYPSKDSPYTYGGWELHQRGWAEGPTLSHTGSNTLNYAKVWIAPRRNLFVLSVANIGGDEAFLAKDAFIQELLKRHLY